MELHVIRYIAEECERQYSGEMSVYHMCEAWEWAVGQSECYNCIQQVPTPHDQMLTPPSIDFIEYIGTLVDPVKNKLGFRTIQVGINDPNFGWLEKAPWQRIPELLSLLVLSYNEGKLEPTHRLANDRIDQFYYEFEEIHPFRDGNGRTGKILYNYLHNTLLNPIMPPDFWGNGLP